MSPARNRHYLAPDDLIAEIDDCLRDNQRQPDRVLNKTHLVIVEVSESCVEFIILTPNLLGSYCRRFRRERLRAWTAVVAQNPEDALGDALRNGLLTMVEDAQYASQFFAGFVLGTLVRPEFFGILGSVFEADFFPLTQGIQPPPGLPPDDVLDTFLSGAIHIAPHTLQVMALELVPHGDTMRISWASQDMYYAQDDICLDAPVGRFELQALQPGEPVNVYFQEVPPGGPVAYYYYSVTPPSAKFGGTVCFDEYGSRRIEWTPKGTEESVIGPFSANRLPQVGGKIPMYEVAGRLGPEVALVVESTLGMDRAILENEGRMAPETATDFWVVGQLCKHIIQNLDDTCARFLVLFYGDTEPAPPEHRLRGLEDRANKPIDYLLSPRRGQVFFDARRLVEEIDRGSFEDKQTFTLDWYKSLERAAYELTRLPWGQSDRIAIWIGQSSPHLYVPEGGTAPVDQPGFTSPFSFEEELQRTRELGIEHVALFVSKDIPGRKRDDGGQSDELEREAREYWRMIGGDDQFYDIGECSLPDHADLRPGILGSVRDLFRYGTAYLIRSNHPNRHDLPFVRAPRVVPSE